MFLESVNFTNSAKQFVIENFSLKSGTQQSLFDSAVVFATGEMRAFLFMLTSADPNVKINPNSEINMGTLYLDWKNYFGDPGSLKIGPYKTVAKQTAKDMVPMEVRAMDQTILSLEEPSV